MGGRPAPAPEPPAPARFTAPQSYTPTHLAEKILTSRAALEGERKQVSVLFADLKGSMELLIDREPDEARRLLDPVLTRMMEAVHHYEGTVNQVMGDGIMALFGAPLAHEDHAVRACYAALRMRDSVARYGDELLRVHGVPVQIRIGLNSGDVVVRSIGSDLRMDYTAVGQTTHLAARMEQMARPGAIFLTPETLRQAEAFLRVTPLGPIPVKGVAEPVEVFELTGVTATRTRLQAAAARGFSRFVGREAEFDVLRHAVERARQGRGQVVAIVGEPGVGKSQAMKRLLLRESQVQPLLLVFEDLHWIDAETQALLDGLVEGLPSARMLLLVNYRPQYHHPWGSKSYYGQLRLDPLGAESAEMLLHALLGDDASLEPLKRLLVERTGGNPFFLEETVRTLAEEKALVGERGAYRLAKALPTFQVPVTVQALLAARIDRLPPEDKRLLQAASAIGKEVPLTLLEDIVDLSDEGIRHGLSRLQAAEFVYETTLFPELEYTFNHALTQEVAYGSLLGEQRRALHTRIVNAMERLYADRLTEHADRLAHHAFRGEVWSKALTYLMKMGATGAPLGLDAPSALAGPDSPAAHWWVGDYDRAVKAGQRDLAVASNFRNFGLSVVSRFRLAQTYHALGQAEQAEVLFRQNVTALEGDLVRERFGMRGLASVFSRTWLAWCLADRGEFPEGLDHAREAVAIAESEDDTYSRVVAYFGIGQISLERGDVDHAAAVLERALVLTRVEEIPLLFPWVAAPLGAAYTHAGRATDAVPLLEQATQHAGSMRLAAHQALRVAWLGEAELSAGRWDRAHQAAARALALAQQHKERGHETYGLRLLGDVAASREPADAEQAQEHYRQAGLLAAELGLRPLKARCHLSLGILYARMGRPAEARAELTAALGMFREMEMSYWLSRADAELLSVPG